jgi:hypothetical protein
MVNKIEITLEAIDEDETPEESERLTGSCEGYAEAVRDTMDIATGKWGWCIAVTRARLMDKSGNTIGEGTSYLGNCSYVDANDFVNSGYFPQKVEEAIKEAHAEALAKESVGRGG